MRTKRNITTVLILFVFIQLFSQTLFQKTFGYGKGEKLIKSLDNNLIVLAERSHSIYCDKMNETGYRYNFWLIKINNQGEIIWITPSKIDGYSRNPFFIHETNNNEFNIIVDTYQCPPGPFYSLYKMDSTGKILTEKFLTIDPSTISMRIYDACINKNEYILCGDIPWQGYGLVVAFNQNGDTIYSRSFKYLSFDKIESCDDGGYILISERIIMKTNASVTIEWKKNVDAYWLNVNKDLNNNYLICGSIIDSIVNNKYYSHPYILYLNSQGDTINSKEFSNYHNWRFLRINQVNDTLFIAVQCEGIIAYQSELKYNLVFLDKNLNISSKISLDNIKSFVAFEKIDSNLYILGGTQDSYILLIKTNFNGEIAQLTLNVDMINVENDITIFPNPSKKIVSVRSQKTINSVYVYNYYGSLVCCKSNLRSKSLDININDFEIGLYLFQFRFENNTMSTKKIIKE